MDSSTHQGPLETLSAAEITFDGDEVGAAFVGDRLGQQRFAAAWWPVEQNSFGGRHPELVELLRVLDREQNHLLQGLLGFLET